MILQDMTKQKLIQPPNWLNNNCIYLSVVGSQAYGTATKDSDTDLYGIVIPPKRIIFPSLQGVILNFDKNIESFDQFRAEHISYKQQEYDITIFNIVKIFRLMADANPNAVELLFTDTDCILHRTSIGNTIRENRHIFFSKKMFHTFMGYSYSQLSKIGGKRTGKRVEIVNKFGYDTKSAGHLVRLLLEIEQILTTKDLNLRQSAELLKHIRQGLWSQDKIIDFFTEKEKYLTKLYEDSDLPNKPREKEIKELLLTCLEKHYGKLDNVIERDKNSIIVAKIQEIFREYS